jgi:hypothetical protein
MFERDCVREVECVGRVTNAGKAGGRKCKRDGGRKVMIYNYFEKQYIYNCPSESLIQVICKAVCASESLLRASSREDIEGSGLAPPVRPQYQIRKKLSNYRAT